MLSAINKSQDVQTRRLVLGLSEEEGGGGGLCRVQVNSEQVGLESLAEAGERLGRPDMSRELIPPLRSQNREELGLFRIKSDYCSAI